MTDETKPGGLGRAVMVALTALFFVTVSIAATPAASAVPIGKECFHDLFGIDTCVPPSPGPGPD